MRWEESGHLILGLLLLSIPSFLSSPIVAEQVSYEVRVGLNGQGGAAKDWGVLSNFFSHRLHWNAVKSKGEKFSSP